MHRVGWLIVPSGRETLFRFGRPAGRGAEHRPGEVPAGRAWIDAQDVLDQMLKSLEDFLAEGLSAGRSVPRRALDVCYGTGSTAVAIARRLGPSGRATGIDISAPMIAAAQARARAERQGTPASFIRADARIRAFEPASFDRVISRFGVMFFDDPIQAFANLRTAAREEANLQCPAWRSPAENPFMTTAEHAAAPLPPNLPARRPVDVCCVLPERDLTRHLIRLGPLGRALEQLYEETRTRVIETIRAAFAYVRGAEVRLTAACWAIGARAPSTSARRRSTRATVLLA